MNRSRRAQSSGTAIQAGTSLAVSLSVLAVNGADAATIATATNQAVQRVPAEHRVVALTQAVLTLVHLQGALITAADTEMPGFREGFQRGHNAEVLRQMGGHDE